jgi:homoserine dehydrogenase
VNVAIVGFGTVGQAVARILVTSPGPLRLTHICNRHVERKRADWVPPDVVWTERFDDILAAPVDIVAELVGGLEPAGTWVARALAAGKSVVTANKQLMAHRGGELLALAAAHDRHLGFEASVAGGIPVIRAVRDGLAGDRLVGISGILNGTCNYILTRMESEGLAFDEALAEARARGYAEADPTDDLDGYDARAKLCILARVGLRTALAPEQVACRSIRPVTRVDFVYASRLGCTIRQVSQVTLGAEGEPVVAWVQPCLVRRTSPLARVHANQNLVLVAGRFGGETGFSGFGAGGGPTAVAVVSDLIGIAEQGHGAHPDRLVDVATPAAVTDRVRAPYYLRFVVQDRPGIIARLADILARHGINIDAVLQEPGVPKSALPFVVTLEECEPASLAGALEAMAALDFHVQAPFALPILS